MMRILMKVKLNQSEKKDNPHLLLLSASLLPTGGPSDPYLIACYMATRIPRPLALVGGHQAPVVGGEFSFRCGLQSAFQVCTRCLICAAPVASCGPFV